MRCVSVQALWDGSTPPGHDVVACFALDNPPSLWSGSSNGDIILWRLSTSSKEPWPMAMLCGHSTPIVGFESCNPRRIQDVGENSLPNTGVSQEEEAVMSVCIEGWLCVWDSLTGHCRRRKRLPSWVGSPSSVKSLSFSRRYVCVAGNGADSELLQSMSFTTENGNRKPDDDNNSVLSIQRIGSMKRFVRGAVVVVDSSTLSISLVVHSGSLNIGSIRSVATVPEKNRMSKIVACDRYGRLQNWCVDEERQQKEEVEALQMEQMSICSPRINSQCEGALVVSISPDGRFLLSVFQDYWIITSTEGSSEDAIQTGRAQQRSGWAGGLFLSGSSVHEAQQRLLFLVWDIDGEAILYAIHDTDYGITADSVCQIPGIGQGALNFSFRVFHECIACIGGGQRDSTTEASSEVWLRLWHVPTEFFSRDGPSEGLEEGISYSKSVKNAILFGEGGLRKYWSGLTSNPSLKEETILQKLTSKETDVHDIVTSSMLISDASFIPLIIVFGFRSGKIKIVELEVIKPPPMIQGGSLKATVEGPAVQYLLRHTNSVLCLAEHSIATETNESNSGDNYGRLLISGGMDMLVCIWDLRNCQILAVLHHHVAPVIQIILPPPNTNPPWSNSFVTSGEDGGVAIVSLETLRVERMFPGHPFELRKISWDSVRGYIACLCNKLPVQASGSDSLYIWDVKSGGLERDLHGSAAHSMFDNFVKRAQGPPLTNGLLPGRATSVSSLLQDGVDSPRFAKQNEFGHESNMKTVAAKTIEVSPPPSHAPPKGNTSLEDSNKVFGSFDKLSSKLKSSLRPLDARDDTGKAPPSNFVLSSQRDLFHKQQPIKGVCSSPSVVALQFDLFTLMAPDLGRLGKGLTVGNQTSSKVSKAEGDQPTGNNSRPSVSVEEGARGEAMHEKETLLRESNNDLIENEFSSAKRGHGNIEGCLLRASLSYLHLWGIEPELDRLLEKELQIFEPVFVGASAGLDGDKGAVTLLFPGMQPTLELCKISPEFSALRMLTVVAIAQRMITLSKPTSHASMALASFYTRELSDKLPEISPPSLEMFACFWQDPSEHVRLASRSLFHSNASKAIPRILLAEESECELDGDITHVENLAISQANAISASPSDEIKEWLELFEGQKWTSYVGGTIQEAWAVRIIVGAALVVWFPGLVKPSLAPTVAPLLVRLVKAVIDRHSATAAELLADGMESIWRHLISAEIPQLISDIFLLVGCLSRGASTHLGIIHTPATAVAIREALSSNLLPTLAAVDIMSFLKIVNAHLSPLSGDSSILVMSLMAIIRIVRGAPRAVVQHLSQVTAMVMQTMHAGKHCYQSAIAAIREMIRVFPMVAVHKESGKLAVGDALGDVRSLAIHVYDLHSGAKLKVLDASGPPGHPALLMKDGSATAVGGMSALSFSPDGEGLVAFSQHGLMIRWWSLGTAWWEKLSRPTTPVQCTKLVLVPPWAGFSPKSSRSSIMSMIHDHGTSDKDELVNNGHEDSTNKLFQSVKLSFRLEWKDEKKVALIQNGQELGVFQF